MKMFETLIYFLLKNILNILLFGSDGAFYLLVKKFVMIYFVGF